MVDLDSNWADSLILRQNGTSAAGEVRDLAVSRPRSSVDAVTHGIWLTAAEFHRRFFADGVSARATSFRDHVIGLLSKWSNKTFRSQKYFWQFSKNIETIGLRCQAHSDVIFTLDHFAYASEVIYINNTDLLTFECKGELKDLFDIDIPFYLNLDSVDGGGLERDLSPSAISSIAREILFSLKQLEESVSIGEFLGFLRVELRRHIEGRSTLRFRRLSRSATAQHAPSTRNWILGFSLHTGTSPPRAGAHSRPATVFGARASPIWPHARDSEHAPVCRRNNKTSIYNSVREWRPETRVASSTRKVTAPHSSRVSSRRRRTRQDIALAEFARPIRHWSGQEVAYHLCVERRIWCLRDKARTSVTVANLTGVGR